MSKISFDNLDKWLFNFHEGNLTSSEKRELQQFLDAHPELQEESDAWGYTKYSAPLAPYAFEAELHAIAGASTINYRKWSVLASLLLLIGSSAYLYFSSDNSIDLNFPQFSNTDINKNNTYDRSLTNSSDNTINTFNGATNNQNLAANYSQSSTINFGSETGSYFTSYSGNQHLNNLTASIGNQNVLNTLNPSNGSSNSVFAKNQISYPANVDPTITNHKTREEVSVDIVNEVRITIEHETIIVYEDEEKKILANKSNDPEEDTKLELELKLKENQSNHYVSDNKSGPRNNKKRRSRHSLDPNPTFTNMRDHILLTTNSHLIDQQNGFAGNVMAPRFSLNYRNNWTGTDVNSQNAMFTYDQLLRKIKTGIALTANYNNYNGGMFNTTGVALTISPKFKLGRGTTFEPAVTISYAQKSAKNMEASIGSFIEDRRGNVAHLYRNGILPSQSIAYSPDVKIGGLFQTKKFWAAATVDHILMPKEPLYGTENNLYRNTMQFRATVGTDYIHIPERGNVFSPQVTINYHDGYTEMWGGLNARFRQFVIGGSVSQLKDFVVMTGIKTPSFMLTYQFDQTHSQLMDKSLGSHEVALRFALNGNSRKNNSILNGER